MFDKEKQIFKYKLSKVVQSLLCVLLLEASLSLQTKRAVIINRTQEQCGQAYKLTMSRCL